VEGQEHFYMETQTILAIPQTEDKEMVLHLGTQFPTHVQVTGGGGSSGKGIVDYPIRFP
jgi:xanthine dehydrogenase molybdopterin-binding subunit B